MDVTGGVRIWANAEGKIYRSTEARMNVELTPTDKIKMDPQFQELVRKRSRFAWALTITMFVIYFGYIGVIAFNKQLLAIPIGFGVITLGIPVGLFVIVSAFILTGIYVRRANSEFDALTKQIIDRVK
jgi:uncharacterized membrane protein (DUF485 family)